MCGANAMQESLITVTKLDDFVTGDQLLRGVRRLESRALSEINAGFNEIYAPSDLDSIAPK